MTSHLVRHPVGVAGIALVLLFLVLASAAPLIAPFDPIAQPSGRLLPPGGRHLVGTDEFGRDVLSRIIFGSRVSLQVGVISVGIARVVGGTVGIVSGFYLGLVDSLVMRVVDIVSAFPTIILSIAISGVLGPSITTAMLAIGASRRRIMFRYILPNIAAPVIVQATLSFSTAILAEATLSFPGLGTQPPEPSWGTMLNAGRRYLELAPWVAIYPGLAIALTVLGLNMFGDALRDALDPRLRQV